MGNQQFKALYQKMGKTQEPPLQKQCRIKTDGLIRYQKEYNSYVKEKIRLENKLAKITEEGDPYEIKRWKEVLDDSTQMLPNVKGKMEQQVEDLEMFLEEYEGNEELESNEELMEKAKST